MTSPIQHLPNTDLIQPFYVLRVLLWQQCMFAERLLGNMLPPDTGDKLNLRTDGRREQEVHLAQEISQSLIITMDVIVIMPRNPR